ncbi:MAG: FAD-binding protein [Candidatus Lokiarchaeota archaeon]|nr:FAD-binding protein [Candidatus Lokiarchaeota archaeon]
MMKMKLDNDIYEKLQKILGKRNVSNDPVITQTYAFNWGNETVNIRRGNEPSMFVDAPIAVVLPGSTEEVQKTLKVINEVGLKFKAQSTGLGPWNCVSSEDAVLVDLRRMNKIRKIDPKNMYAIVEPYVTGGNLQAELMKYNLNCHMPGAGPHVSPLASSTSMCGPSFTSESTGFSGRNLLGTEWVLPDGKLVKIGSLGLKTNSRWFSGDGPGFSLRGVIRGASGAKSGLGIFTACAIKLYPYPCDTKWNITGVSPNYEFEIPNFMEYHIIRYRNWDAVEDAMYRFTEEEISFMIWSTSNVAVGALFSKDRADFMNNVLNAASLGKPLVILICANTKREFEYKKKMYTKILEETKGKDLVQKGKFVPSSKAFVEAIRHMLAFHGFIATGSFQSTFGGIDSIGLSYQMVKLNIPLKKEYIDKKLLPNDQGEGIFVTTYEYGQYSHCEMPTMYNTNKKESRDGMVEYMEDCDDLALEENLNIPFFIEGDELHDKWGPHVCNYNVWLRKIKEAFDPKNSADSGFYISTEDELKESKK